MTQQEEQEFADNFNLVFTRIQLDAIKATLSDNQKAIYNQVLLGQREELLNKIQGLPQTKLSEISRFFDEALI